MKNFNFSMQKVLEYKSHIEDSEKIVLSQMRCQYEKLCDELNEIKNEYERLKTEYVKMCSRGTIIREITIARSYMTELNAKIDWMLLKIERAENEIEKQIGRIIEISKEKNSMERLKDRHNIVYREQQRKETEIFIDDFVANTNHSGIWQ